MAPGRLRRGRCAYSIYSLYQPKTRAQEEVGSPTAVMSRTDYLYRISRYRYRVRDALRCMRHAGRRGRGAANARTGSAAREPTQGQAQAAAAPPGRARGAGPWGSYS